MVLYLWFRKEGKEWEAITVYCWLFPTGWLWSRCYCPNFTDEETEAPRRELPEVTRWRSWDLDLGLSWLWTWAFSSSPPLPVLVTDSTRNVFSELVSPRRRWHPTPLFLPGKSHGPGSLVGCSPWGCEESDTTEAT